MSKRTRQMTQDSVVQMIRPALALVLLLTVLTGAVLPLIVTGIAGLVAPGPAGGSLIERGGVVVGSALIGQTFTSDKYFASRPSATTDTDPNDPTKTIASPDNGGASGGSNLGPTSKDLLDRIKGDVGKLGPAPVPADAVTTSASGLDPHISPENAARQVARVATARGMSEDAVRAVLAAHTEGRAAGLIGEPRVNVLELNLALDAAAH